MTRDPPTAREEAWLRSLEPLPMPMSRGPAATRPTRDCLSAAHLAISRSRRLLDQTAQDRPAR